MSSISQDVATIAREQAAALIDLAGIIPDVNKEFSAVIAAIVTTSIQDQAGQAKLLTAVEGIASLLEQMVKVQAAIAADVVLIRLAVVPDTTPVKIFIDPGQPIERKVSMATLTAAWAKKSKMKKAAIPHKAGMAAVTAFQFTDNEDGTATVNGLNAAGDVLDLSATYTLTPVPTSDNTAVVTVDAPVGMTFGYHGLSVGSANVTATATQNSGVTPAAGPFAFTLPMTCVSDGTPTGIVINPGTPVARPPVVVTPPTGP